TCMALRLPRLTDGSIVAVARLMAQPVVVVATAARAASSNAVFFNGIPFEQEAPRAAESLRASAPSARRALLSGSAESPRAPLRDRPPSRRSRRLLRRSW